MKRIILIVSVLAIIITCKSKKEMTTPVNGEASQEMLELVTSDLYGGAEEEVFQVIRSAGELEKFYRQVNMTRKPGLQVPKIDFVANTAVLYCSGTTVSTQMPKIFVASQNETEMVLKKAFLAESDSLKTGTAKLTPFGLYLLPFTDKQVILSPN